MSAKKVFWILFLLNLLNYIDRQVLYAVFPLLQQDLALTDMQLGMIASVFMIAYMGYAPVVGYFAARTPKRYWIGASALMWSLATGACALAKNFSMLLTARSVIGAGEAGFTTLAPPFLAEHSAKEKRATILSVFNLALPAGAALGYVFGGIVGEYVGWRAAFLLAGFPGLILGILALTQLREPVSAVRAQGPGWRDYKKLFQNKPFLWICLAHAVITFIMGGLSAWMPTYLTRYLGFSVSRAGFVFGILIIGCGAGGTYVGGKWADWRLKRTQNAYFQVIATSLLGTCLAGGAGLCFKHPAPALAAIGLAVFCLFMPLGPVAALLVNLTQKAVRPMAFALNIFIIHMLGDALSPVLIGHWSGQWNLKIAIFWVLATAVFGWLFVQLASAALVRKESC